MVIHQVKSDDFIMEEFDIRKSGSANSEKDFENALRPLAFGDFSGQQKVVENLEVFVEAAKYRGGPCSRVWSSGSPLYFAASTNTSRFSTTFC